MISLYSGTPGSGKSLHLARTVRDSLKFSCPVIGTFHINKDMLWKNSKYPYTYVNIYDLTPRDLLKYAEENKKYLKHNVEGSFLLVIDECQRIFNSRTWQETKNRNEWITFFAEHTHSVAVWHKQQSSKTGNSQTWCLSPLPSADPPDPN